VIKVKLVKQFGLCYHDGVQLQKIAKTALNGNHRVNLIGAGKPPARGVFVFLRRWSGGSGRNRGRSARSGDVERCFFPALAGVL